LSPRRGEPKVMQSGRIVVEASSESKSHSVNREATHPARQCPVIMYAEDLADFAICG